jgi:hypothetical protein
MRYASFGTSLIASGISTSSTLTTILFQHSLLRGIQCFVVTFVKFFLIVLGFYGNVLGYIDLVEAYWTWGKIKSEHTPYYDRWMIILDDFLFGSLLFHTSDFAFCF